MAVYQLVYSQMITNRTLRLFHDAAGTLFPDYSARRSELVNEFQCLKETLENTDHTFIFIITKKQWEGWRAICGTYGYDEYTLFQMTDFVHNQNYTADKGYNETNGGGRKLRLVILKGKGTHED